MATDIRRPLYSGSQPVRALWFDCALQGEDAARRRVLAHWETGARAYALNNGYLLEWRAPRRLLCEQVDGLPLCEHGGRLASAPLLSGESTSIAPGHVVLVLGATLHSFELGPQLRIDPSRWLDLSALALHAPLAMPAQHQGDFVVALDEAPADVRALLGDAVPPPSARRAEFLRRAANVSTGQSTPKGGGALKLLGAAALLGGVAAMGVVGWLGALLPRDGAGPAPAVKGGRAGARAAAAPPAGASPLRQWLSRQLDSLLMMSKVSDAIGWRQASYLREMLDQFEQGDLAEALRHAIPLDDPTPAARRAYGLPGRRDSLDISGAAGSAAGIGLDNDTTNHLRAVYRRSFEALDRAGRIEEAVFVLAELLNCRAEAVDYLERKGRVRQAAQMAETLDLAPAQQVRLYCMAGDTERAVLLARLAGCFAEAVAELERRKHEAAPSLRLQWALELAERGEPGEAARVVWPLKEERQRALTWLNLALQAGGTVGIQALVYRLALDPHAMAESGDAVQSLIEGEGPEASQLRMRAAACLSALDEHSSLTRRLSGELWRVLVVERIDGANGIARDELSKLLALAADPVLNADQPTERLPDAARVQALSQRSTPLQVTLAERGLHPVRDVRRVPDGGYLLALGDAGVMHVRRDGQQLALFPVPAHSLVVSDNGQRALALAHREKVVRVSRIDLMTRKVADWFSAPLEYWSQGYDGSSWNVVAGDRLLALDAMATGQSVLWQVADFPGHIAGFNECDGKQALLLRVDETTVEQWRYSLPQRRLLQRDQFQLQAAPSFAFPDCDSEEPFQLALRANADGQAALVVPAGARGRRTGIVLDSVRAMPEVLVYKGMWFWHAEQPEGWRGKLLTMDGRVLAEINLPDARQASARLVDGHLLVWDACGRLVDIDLDTSAVYTLTLG
ncbi:bpX6 domain-containing protein [Massilia sp. SR12]